MWYLVVAHLFVKVSRPEKSEGTCLVFESSCHLSSKHSDLTTPPPQLILWWRLL